MLINFTFTTVIFSILSVFAIATYITIQLTPWPQALWIRYKFNKHGAKVNQALSKYVPTNIAAELNHHYTTTYNDISLDVYYPESIAQTRHRLPTVVWVHGGGWLSGNKKNVANYLKILSSRGYTTVSVGYSLAPRHHYPTQVKQINQALDYLQQHAETLHIDKNQLVLAGDSAGAQIVAQIATMITNREYAKLIGISPSISSKQLKGMLLSCGPYDISLLKKPLSNFLTVILWAYTGDKNPQKNNKLHQLHLPPHITSDYPPTFITAGNADPLEAQSKALADTLKKQHVLVETLFFPADHPAKLPHEYQFNLDNAEGQLALKRIEAFLRQRVPHQEKLKNKRHRPGAYRG